MQLYKIAESYKNLLNVLENNEDEQELIEIVKKSLDEVEGDLVEKCDNIVRYIKNLESDIEGYRKEEKRLNKERKVLENRVESMREYIKTTLENTGSKKIKTSIAQLSLRRTQPKLIIDDESKLEKYKIVKIEYDKKAIKQDLEEKEVEGVHLEQNLSLTIK